MSENLPSLQQLLEQVSGKRFLDAVSPGDRGLADDIRFPFLGLVGQREMKLALLLALINPAISGVLLVGPRGTGKTTAVRSLSDLMPLVHRSLCQYGCLPEDIEAGGMDAVCPDCAKKYGEGRPLTYLDPVKLIELPLNARLEDVVGGLDEAAAAHKRMRIRRGLLAQADQNILYIDEVNLLADEIVDAILDAAAQGMYTVRRGPVAGTYRARFVLIGSMNPEEGRLRPQILDRFGLRLIVSGLTDPDERLEAYRRVRAYLTNPKAVVAAYAAETLQMRDEVQAARNLLPSVRLQPAAEQAGLQLVQRLQIDSLRAEITLFEAARALAAADNRTEATVADVRTVAPLTVRLRRSQFMVDYFNQQQVEEKEIQRVLDDVITPPAQA
ncbi:MAG: ATP-binding protein [Anaerolineales bacterium]|nr:ATP-binding protein [Anaerolineales bacterium]